jgi:hypothetical protein
VSGFLVLSLCRCHRCVFCKGTDCTLWRSSDALATLAACPLRSESDRVICTAANSRLGPLPDSCTAAKFAPLFDHLVGAHQQRRGHAYAKRLRSFEVDHQLELGRRLPASRQASRPLRCDQRKMRTPVYLDHVDPVGRQAAVFRKIAKRVDRGQTVGRERDDQLPVRGCDRTWHHDQAAIWFSRKALDV